MAPTGYTTRGNIERTETAPPLTDPPLSGATSTSNTRGRGGGRGTRTRPTKTYDPQRAQRRLDHAHRTEQAAATRRAEGAAREAARLASIPEHAAITTLTQPTLPINPPNLQPPIPPPQLPLQPPIPPPPTPPPTTHPSLSSPLSPTHTSYTIPPPTNQHFQRQPHRTTPSEHHWHTRRGTLL